MVDADLGSAAAARAIAKAGAWREGRRARGPEGMGAALAAIAAGDLAWSPLAALEDLGHGPALAALLGLGLVALWSADAAGHALEGGPLVTLTPLGAWRAGLSIVEEGAEERPRWGDLGRDEAGDPRPDSRPVVLPGYPGEQRLAFPEQVAGAAPGPVEEAIIGEEFLMADRHRDDGRLDVDPETGRVAREPVLIWGLKVAIDRRMARATARKKGRRRSA